MYNLPSEQQAAAEAAIKEFQESGRIGIYEPCNCGSQIRHNNGGNYHQIIVVARDGDRFFVRFDTTCELMPTPEWEEVSEERAIEIIREHADWL